MDTTRRHRPRPIAMRTLLACAGWIGLLPALSLADGARIAQQARPGEIIVTRTVAARPADRPATAPGMALMVSASPNPQLVNTLTGGNGPGETTDAEIANLNAGPGAAVSPIQTGVQRSVNVALGVNAGGNSAGAISGNGVSNTVSAPAGGGAIADSTRNIGQQVTGALAQIPLLGAGH